MHKAVQFQFKMSCVRCAPFNEQKKNNKHEEIVIEITNFLLIEFPTKQFKVVPFGLFVCLLVEIAFLSISEMNFAVVNGKM